MSLKLASEMGDWRVDDETNRGDAAIGSFKLTRLSHAISCYLSVGITALYPVGDPRPVAVHRRSLRL